MRICWDDIYYTSVCIILRGQINPEEFKLLQDGINRLKGFIHSETYNIDSAIVNASKAAYLSKLIEKGITEIHHYNPANTAQLGTSVLQDPIPTKFNKLKKTNIAAFHYWNEIQKLGEM